LKARDLVFSVCLASEIKEFIEANHYSKSINGVKISICFKSEYCGLLVGAMLFGQMSTTAWKKFGDTEQSVLELRRLVMIDECPKNSESRFIGYCLRYIKANNTTVNTIVSYADPNYGHFGTIYRASNFKYIGMSASDVGYKDIETGKLYHSRALRTKYKGEFKPFVKKLRRKKELDLLEEIKLLGKYCYVYSYNRSNQNSIIPNTP
jgi:hypothetical protein